MANEFDDSTLHAVLLQARMTSSDRELAMRCVHLGRTLAAIVTVFRWVMAVPRRGSAESAPMNALAEPSGPTGQLIDLDEQRWVRVMKTPLR